MSQEIETPVEATPSATPEGEAPQTLSPAEEAAFDLELEVIKYTEAFTIHYFGDLQDFISSEKNFIESNNLNLKEEVDLFGIKRFIYTAINNMLDLDPEISSGIFDKLRRDVDKLYMYYDEFYNRTKLPKLILENNFLKTVEFYTKVVKEFEEQQRNKTLYETQFKSTEKRIKELEAKTDTLTPEEVLERKNLKRKNADAVHHFAEARDAVNRLYEEEKVMRSEIERIFLPEFTARKDTILIELKRIINAKTYLLDKTLWYYAANSKQIQLFFEKSNIKGDFALKTFLDYYLKNVDLELKSANNEWHKYLVKIVEKLK